MVNKNFGQLLRNYRKINQLTQQQVADALNINRTTYTYYETGKTEPSIDNLHRLIQIFGITYDDLLPSEKNCFSMKELYLKSNDAFYNLTTAEQDVVILFRTLSDEDKIRFLDSLKNMELQENKEKYWCY